MVVIAGIGEKVEGADLQHAIQLSPAEIVATDRCNTQSRGD